MEIICIETDNNSTDILKIATTPIILSAPINEYEYELINLDSTSQVNNSTLITTDIIVCEGDFVREESILPNSIRYMGEIYIVNNIISNHNKDKLTQMMSWQANTEIEILDGLEYIATESSNNSIVIAFYRDPLTKEWTYPILTGITNAFTTSSSNKLENNLLEDAKKIATKHQQAMEKAKQILEQQEEKNREILKKHYEETLEERLQLAKEALKKGQKEFDKLMGKIKSEQQKFDGDVGELWNHITNKVEDFQFENLSGNKTLEKWKSDIEGRLQSLEIFITTVDDNKDEWTAEQIQLFSNRLDEKISDFHIKSMQVDDEINTNILDERYLKMQDVFTGAVELNTLFQTASNLVQQQQVSVDIISENVNSASKNVQTAVGDIEKAAAMQSESTGFSWEDFMNFTRLIKIVNQIYQYIRRLLSFISVFNLIY